MAQQTDRFAYDLYDRFVHTAHDVWRVWHGEVRLMATGQRVHRTIDYNAYDDAVQAMLDWADDNMDNEDL
jgi:hypothetical protein